MTEADESRLRAGLARATDTLDISPAPTDSIVRAGRRGATRFRAMAVTATAALVGVGVATTVLTRPTAPVLRATPAAPSSASMPRGSVTMARGVLAGHSWKLTRTFAYITIGKPTGKDAASAGCLKVMTGVVPSGSVGCEHYALYLGRSLSDSFDVAAEQTQIWRIPFDSPSLYDVGSGTSKTLLLAPKATGKASGQTRQQHAYGMVFEQQVPPAVARVTMDFANGSAPISVTPVTVTQQGAVTSRYAIVPVPAADGAYHDITMYDAKGTKLVTISANGDQTHPSDIASPR